MCVKLDFFHMDSGYVSGFLNIRPLSDPISDVVNIGSLDIERHWTIGMDPFPSIGHELYLILFLPKIFSDTYSRENV